jgi:hypothetical protein
MLNLFMYDVTVLTLELEVLLRERRSRLRRDGHGRSHWELRLMCHGKL